VALPITLKSKLRQNKKNYGNSNISPHKNTIFKKKSSQRNQNRSRYHNSLTNLKFQHKPKYHLSKFLVRFHIAWNQLIFENIYLISEIYKKAPQIFF
jgi:hypothetical protein